ncbi:hypothetical protein ABPG72_009997 [Tetrahymena utriculariae]
MLSKQQKIQGGQSSCNVIERSNGKVYFVKCFLSKSDYLNEKTIYQNLNEICNNTKLSILKMIDFDDYNCSLLFPFVKFELARICAQQRVKEDQTKVRGMKSILALYHFTQVANEIKKLHDLNYCHCDIKIHNVLVEQQQDCLKDVLIDFGHCQRIQKNEKSVTPCGTEAYNPLELNQGIAEQNIKPYSPYLLDLYQLGMLLLTLIVYFPIPKLGKKFIISKKKKKFLELITRKYQETYQSNIEIIPEIYDLIWDLLTGEIKESALILDHKVYDLEKVKPMMKTFFQMENKKDNQFEEEVEEISFNHIYLLQKEGGTRSSGSVNIDNELQELLKSNCTEYAKFIEQMKQFCDKKPRKIKENNLQARSLLFEMNTASMLQYLLFYLGKNNPEVFDQDIFVQTKDEEQNQILDVSLIYVSKEIICEDTTDDDDEDLENVQVEEIKNTIQLQIEIVQLEDQNQSQTKSIIFRHIKGEPIYYNNLIQDIEMDLKQYI